MKPRTERPYLPTLLALAGSLAFTAATVAAPASGDNWPEWRGPLQNGVAPSANPPTTWSETNNVKWKAKIPGTGQATPIIWDNRLFIQTAIPTGKKVEAKQPLDKVLAEGVLGDPLALALGVFKVKPAPVAVLMLVGKAARYAVVIGLARSWSMS